MFRADNSRCSLKRLFVNIAIALWMLFVNGVFYHVMLQEKGISLAGLLRVLLWKK